MLPRSIATKICQRAIGVDTPYSAMAELLEVDFALAAKDRLYRRLDRLLGHKPELFVYFQLWQDLFGAEFDVLLCDLLYQVKRHHYSVFGICETMARITNRPPKRLKQIGLIFALIGLLGFAFEEIGRHRDRAATNKSGSR